MYTAKYFMAIKASKRWP